MAYSFSLKEEARALRSKGYSYKEIGEKLHITKSTAYAWTKRVYLNAAARKRIHEIMTLAQINAAKTNRNRRLKRLAIVEKRIDMILSKVKPNKLLYQIMAATLYWAEGGKSSFNALQFINSDPKMISTFLKAFRKGFKIEERKLRCLVHIHEYHNEPKIKAFWSEVTGIPLNQFSKSYLKPHTGKRTRNGYKGCINISYCSWEIAAEIHMLYNKLPQALGASFSGRTRDSKSRDGSSILSAPAADTIKTMNLNLRAIRVICYGDSYTWGYIPATKHERYSVEKRWTGVLQKILGDGFEIIEEGLNSRTLDSDDTRKGKEGRNGATTLIPCLDTHDPIDIVILMLGTNELKDSFDRPASEISQILEDKYMQVILQRKSQFKNQYPKLILIIPPALNLEKEYAFERYSKSAEKHIQMVEIFKDLAKKYSVPYINASEIVQVGDDGVHIDDTNHRKLAEAVAEKITDFMHHPLP